MDELSPKYPTTVFAAHEEQEASKHEIDDDPLKLKSPGTSSSQSNGILKVNLLCFSLGKIPVPLLTITENVSTYLDYYEELRLMNHIPNIVKKQYRQKY